MNIDLYYTPETKPGINQSRSSDANEAEGSSNKAFFALLNGFAKTDEEALNSLLASDQALERIEKALLEIDTLISNDNIKIDDSFFETLKSSGKGDELAGLIQTLIGELNLAQDGEVPSLTDIQNAFAQLGNSEEENGLLIIASNLTPEQLTELQNEDNEKGLESFITGLIELVKPEGDDAEIDQDIVIALQQFTNENKNDDDLSEELAAQLNSIIVSIGEKKQLIKDQYADPNAKLHSTYRGTDGEEKSLPRDVSFKSDVSPKENAKTGDAVKSSDLLNNAALSTPATSGLFTLPEDALLSNLNYTDPVLEQLDSLGGFKTALNSAATATASVTATSAAHAPHPGTQAVAVTMKKLAGSPENRAFTLQLEPPELGKVEVRMTFNEGKQVKALVTSEKPETHFMLQRDVANLERALQEAGLDSDSGIDFQLAEHGFDFDQHNQRGGGHDKGGTGAGDGQNEEIIEATMTWQVDPETGHIRYNILA